MSVDKKMVMDFISIYLYTSSFLAGLVSIIPPYAKKSSQLLLLSSIRVNQFYYFRDLEIVYLIIDMISILHNE